MEGACIMNLRGSVNVWRENNGSLSIYATNHEEEGALGYALSVRSAVLLFELTVLRLTGKDKPCER